MTTQTLTVTSSRNKQYVGKTITLDNETGLATMGRTQYKVSYDFHQPNKFTGDFSIHYSTLNDCKPIKLLRTDTENVNKGIWINHYTFE